MLRQFTNEELNSRFGKIEFDILSSHRSSVEITNNWERENMVIAIIPQLKGIPAYHGKMKDRLYCHREMVAIYKSVFQDFEKQGVLEDVIFFGGCFNRRLIVGSDHKLSTHCRSISLDLNPQWNRLGQEPAKPGEWGSNHRLAKILAAHNFIWGKDFDRKDGMHFQLGFSMAPKKKELTRKQKAIEVIESQLAILKEEERDI